MAAAAFLLFLVLALVFAASVPLGLYMSALFSGRLSERFRLMRCVERAVLWPLGEAGRKPMDWHEYCLSLIALTAAGTAAAYVVFRLQGVLPLNPLGVPGLSPDLAFNAAVSFATSTTWQPFAGEQAMSLLSQAAALTVLTVLSASIGIVAAFAFARGLVQDRDPLIGNAWTDLVRCVLWLLLPLGTVLALFLASQGTVQTWDAQVTLKTLEGAKQSIAVGPVATQEAMRLLTVTGGSFYSANSAHPFVTPSALVCLVQIVLSLLMSGALVFAYGRMTGNVKEGFSILFGMAAVFSAAYFFIAWSEGQANPILTVQGITESLGNMEGKEVRLGPALTSLFAATSAASSAGAAAGSYDSMLPMGGGAVLWLIQLGDVIFGGARSGLYTMLGLAIIAVFVLGMLIGRTPRYIGKKIGAYDMKMVCVALLMPALCTLIGTAVACLVGPGADAVTAPGPHGFTEILFAFSSVSNNNGAGFAGLAANYPFYNAVLGVCMWVSRLFTMTALLAVAGNMASKPRAPDSALGVRTDSPVFSFVFILVAVVISIITYLPALSLGPVIESLRLLHGAM